ncbi:polygalacturonase inhibitor 2 precursor, putative [Entamoeba invadens IP1]|uniref:polygalacturonase inhibitor 2 precursor, putative n=1 Tax=Entamoeba invadens IP1 TaxID=370355 RepID=UPI0002C3F5BC|nr:polygalacturonase inhibitor 2 precursor, putative [Entamoeba invadens IP1]ELP93379.1 polygalacturonase inhibitor 2 precursor, putative [Entamoeba invadens IP1]|eukprot:XP_004260150.1 polygalacturonase inhibitor 2 precursor, putative [Entamoeba invadens IP1]
MFLAIILFTLVFSQQQEKELLTTFFDILNGENWVIRTNWKSERSVCEWYGVECEDGKVLSLNLSSNNLKGEVPPLFVLQHVKKIDVSNNQITGLLTSFNGLQRLDTLIISNNLFKGFANVLGTSLKHFKAANNAFDDVFYFLKNNVFLETLDLSYNSIRTIPRALNKLSNLISLNMKHNKITSEIPPMAALVNLESCDFSENTIVGTIPNSLGTLPRLVDINLSKSNLSGPIPHSLFLGKSLEKVDISYTHLSGHLVGLDKAKHLKKIDMKNTQITGKIPSLFGSSLTELDVTNTSIECPILAVNKLKVISDCPERVRITLHGMSKCGDFTNAINNAIAPLNRELEDIVDYTFGWIVTPTPEKVTGYSSMHGDTEVDGDFLFSCSNEVYNSTVALNLYQCMSRVLYLIPSNLYDCTQKLGIDPIPISDCMMGEVGQKLMKEGLQDVERLASHWSPTIYINEELYCLYDTNECKAMYLEDWIRDVCLEYKGYNKPKACYV